MKGKVIHIMSHCPAYEEYSDKPRPVVNWNTPGGLWVGIAGYDWADQLAIEVRKINCDMDHEIWQPDFRADKIYSHEIFPGVIHRLFPSEKYEVRVGWKKKIFPYSPQMITFLNKTCTGNTIFHIGQSITCPINKSLIDSYIGNKFIFSFHGQISLPYNSLFRVQKNIWAKYFYFKEHYQAKKLFEKIDYVTFQSNKYFGSLNKYYKGQVKKLTMGIYFDKFRGYEKYKCRDDLNFPQEKKIILTVCRLNKLKQIDKIIEVLCRVEEDFLFVVTGHGTRRYEEYLYRKAKKLLSKNKIIFTGYKYGEELTKIFNSADLFIHTSKSEAGPVSVMEAMACGLPILCTDTGHTAELLKANKAGVVVGISRYREWKEKLTEYLQGSPIKTLDLNIVRDNYDWHNIATQFLAIYKNC